ncbi:hypothetical protein SDC9_200852 [bioreactor metagenome]|uniref:Uncharacterized protein n=1 Tax=bioreactor metagenome TaxID=1076179 RepID=A0A645IPC5_9ZZZZ
MNVKRKLGQVKQRNLGKHGTADIAHQIIVKQKSFCHKLNFLPVTHYFSFQRDSHIGKTTNCKVTAGLNLFRRNGYGGIFNAFHALIEITSQFFLTKYHF